MMCVCTRMRGLKLESINKIKRKEKKQPALPSRAHESSSVCVCAARTYHGVLGFLSGRGPCAHAPHAHNCRCKCPAGTSSARLSSRLFYGAARCIYTYLLLCAYTARCTKSTRTHNARQERKSVYHQAMQQCSLFKYYSRAHRARFSSLARANAHTHTHISLLVWIGFVRQAHPRRARIVWRI